MTAEIKPRILIVHNRYGSEAPSGENIAVDAERDLLRSRGHDVAEFSRFSDDIRSRRVLGPLQGALATPWNPWSFRKLRQKIDQFNPDIVHVHNTFPLISPSAFYSIGPRAGTVLTLHNYRLFCAAAMPMRNGNVCTQCLDRRSIWPALKHACYRGQRIATIPLAAGIALHRSLGTWSKRVDLFVALTDFQRELMANSGLAIDQIKVKPNFFPGSPSVKPWLERADRVVFVGRLSSEKGVSELVEAWIRWGADAPELAVIGDGPLKEALGARISACGVANVRLVGQVSSKEAQNWIATSKLMMLPSKWFEGFPMTLRESMAFGTPAIVSDLGPLPGLVAQSNSGAVVRAGDIDGLVQVTSAVWRDKSKLQKMGEHARQEYQAKYTEEANYSQLIDIYSEAIRHNHTVAESVR